MYHYYVGGAILKQLLRAIITGDIHGHLRRHNFVLKKQKITLAVWFNLRAFLASYNQFLDSVTGKASICNPVNAEEISCFIS